ncbi:MAG TPA: hypothetical protein VE175_11565, partial [Woeseiaceae bacterium]|nr:hypothetical protein [Woeseiaceae bacterium]
MSSMRRMSLLPMVRLTRCISVLAVFPAVLVLAGCAAMTATEPVTGPSIPVRLTPFPYNSDVHGNDLPVEIGRFDVPARRDADGAGTIEVGFVRYPAPEGVAAPPIVILTREERPSARRQALYAELRSLGDVVVFNRRGYGFSSPPPPCPARLRYPFEHPLERARLSDAMSTYATGCIAAMKRGGLDPSAYARKEVAGDLADLTRALEADRIRLIAEGDLAALAASALRRDPQLVESAVFVNPRAEEGPADFDGFLSALDGLRAAQGARPLADGVTELRQRLRTAPVDALAISKSGRRITVRIGALDYALIVAAAVAGESDAWTRLITTTESALAGDAAQLAELALEQRARLGQPPTIELIEGIEAEPGAMPSS